ncbi:MAG: peptide deformylase [Clostridiales bacterium]|nr:peptide deformylase [Clostridiales bacterium]
MIQPIMRDPLFLAVPSERAGKADKQIALDLLDTLRANLDGCVGMAANMIGAHKRIIAVHTDIGQIAMLNPKIVKKDGVYETEEGCLSLAGVRKAKRYQSIEVEYQDLNMKKQRRSFSGFTAQIIQHEIDHCDGILI